MTQIADKVSRNSPRPLITERLQWLIDSGVGIGTVLDVGVQGGTEFLISCCPRIHHILFEPVDEYFSTIHKRYTNEKISHELVHAALSDKDGSAWQLGFSRDGSGKVTHSQISDNPEEVGSKLGLVSCKEVPKLMLDTAISSRSAPKPYLLKVDVDGHEMPILIGARATLADCSIVIVEATVSTVGTKINFMENAGFTFVDIVDNCYYYGMLSQVDLIFVHRDWIQRCDDLRPWQTKPFSWAEWAALARNKVFSISADVPTA